MKVEICELEQPWTARFWAWPVNLTLINLKSLAQVNVAWLSYHHLFTSHLWDIHHEPQTMLGIEGIKINKISSYSSEAQMINEDKQTFKHGKGKG